MLSIQLDEIDMAFHIRDPETDALTRELARERGCGLTEAVKLAVRNELQRERNQSMVEKLRALSAEVSSWPRTGLKADNPFFDELSGDED
jgi:antitoxin VapB